MNSRQNSSRYRRQLCYEAHSRERSLVSCSKSSFVLCVSGTLLQPKAGMILRMAIMDCQGHLFPSPFQFWVEKDSHHNKSESDIFVASGVILACWNVAKPFLELVCWPELGVNCNPYVL